MIEKINEDLKLAMKNKDTFKLSVLRMLKSALELESKAKKEELNDNEVLNIVKKQVKLRKDSKEEYEKYNKLDLAHKLEEEIKILAEYLPEELSEEALTEIIEEVLVELKPESMKDMGKVMRVLNEKLTGKNADLALVSKIVKEKLSK